MEKKGIAQYYGKKFSNTPEFMKEIGYADSKMPDKQYVCIGVKASNYFMPKETLSEKGPGGGGWILMNQQLAVMTRDKKVWGATTRACLASSLLATATTPVSRDQG